MSAISGSIGARPKSLYAVITVSKIPQKPIEKKILFKAFFYFPNLNADKMYRGCEQYLAILVIDISINF